MPRGIWKGTLGFGLVSIGVELLTAERAEELDLDLLDKRDHARIGYQKINKTTGEPVVQSDIVRGAEVGDGKYVVLSDADFKAANPKATQSVDILEFVAASDIPLVYYDRPYYVSPMKGSDKAYGLLRDAMTDAALIGLAQIVIHTRQHLAAVYPHEGAIVVQLLRYAHTLKSPEDAGVKHVPHAAKSARAPEFTMAKELIGSMTSEWKPTQFKDSYKEDLLKLIKQRAKKGTQVSTPRASAASVNEPRVLDLVAALRGSLKRSGSTAAKSTGKRAVAKKSVTRPAKRAAKRA